MPTYAYFQSHTEKSIDLVALKARCAGHHVYAKNYFVDESKDRKHFEELLAKLRLGDTVVIDTLSSLGSNNAEIAANWNVLRNEKHVHIVVMDEEFLDTRLRGEDVPDKCVADLIMGTFTRTSDATTEIRRRRQRRGISEALQKGTRFGTARRELPAEFERYAELYLAHSITLREAAEKTGIPKSTFAYRARLLEAERDT